MAEQTERVTLAYNHTVFHNGTEYGPGEVDLPVEAVEYMRKTGELPPKVIDPNDDPLLARAQLQAAGITTIERLREVQAMSDDEILQIKGIGPSTLKVIRDAQLPEVQ